jgi:hypothetical protein
MTNKQTKPARLRSMSGAPLIPPDDPRDAIPSSIVHKLCLQGFRFDGDDNEDKLVAALAREGVKNPRRALKAYFDNYPVSDELIRRMFGRQG